MNGNGCIALASGLLVVCLLGACSCGGAASLLSSPAPRSGGSPSTAAALPSVPAEKSAEVKPTEKADNSWAASLANRRLALAKEITSLGRSDRVVFEKLRGGGGYSTLTGRIPQVGDVGRLDEITFLTIADSRTAQFSDGDRTLFLRGVDLNQLVPLKPYKFSGVYEVVDFVEFTTLVGIRRRGPLLKFVDPEAAEALYAKERALGDQERRLCPITRDGSGPRALYFVGITSDRAGAMFETEPGVKEIVPLSEIDPEERAAIIELSPFNPYAQRPAPSAPVDPGVQAWIEAGHKFRPRTWSSADGKFSVEASFVSGTEAAIKLRRVDNAKEISIERSKLSADDLDYVRKRAYQAERLEAKEPPSAFPSAR